MLNQVPQSNKLLPILKLDEPGLILHIQATSFEVGLECQVIITGPPCCTVGGDDQILAVSTLASIGLSARISTADEAN